MLCFAAEVLGLAPAPANSDQATNLFSSSSFRDSDNKSEVDCVMSTNYLIHCLHTSYNHTLVYNNHELMIN